MSEQAVFKSVEEIEAYFNEEKKKVGVFLHEVERKKALAIIGLARKQVSELVGKRKALVSSGKQLFVEKREASDEINGLRSKVKAFKRNSVKLKGVSKSLNSIDGKLAVIIARRRKESSFEASPIKAVVKAVGDSKQFFSENSGNFKHLLDLSALKSSMLKGGLLLLDEEKAKLFAHEPVISDELKLLASSLEKCKLRIKALEKELKQVSEKKVGLDASKQNLDGEIEAAKKQVEKLVLKYSKVI